MPDITDRDKFAVLVKNNDNDKVTCSMSNIATYEQAKDDAQEVSTYYRTNFYDMGSIAPIVDFVEIEEAIHEYAAGTDSGYQVG